MTTPKCKVCGKAEHVAHGLCGRCYMRDRRGLAPAPEPQRQEEPGLVLSIWASQEDKSRLESLAGSRSESLSLVTRKAIRIGLARLEAQQARRKARRATSRA